MAHLIGAHGQFWNRDRVEWGARNWQLLGRQEYTHNYVQVVDFRRARGIYILHDDHGPYYVGLATGRAGIGGRLIDHTRDHHHEMWTRFSWFSFDSVNEAPGEDGIYGIEPHGEVEMNGNVAIRELEAMLQVVMAPRGNRNRTRFKEADSWSQLLAFQPEESEILEHLRNRMI
jgi:hypothetical protein